MANNKFFDFDQFMEERNGGSFEVKAFGKMYQLPNEIPFDVVLGISRAHKNGVGEISEEDTVKFAETLFGKEVFAEWLQKGIGLSGVMVLMENVMKMYMENASNMSQGMAAQKSANNPTP